MNKNETSDTNDIPQLDPQTANQLLGNVFAACDKEPNTIPVEVLESWGNYKKHRFDLGQTISYVFLIILILFPLMFFRPSIVAERTNVDSTISAVYDIHIRTLLPLQTVSATLNDAPVTLQKESSKEYRTKLTDNGTLKIKAVAFNGQTTTRTYNVIHIDKDKPVLKTSYTRDGLVYLEVQDTYSGINYQHISGLTPDHYDTDTGILAFPIPDAPVTVTIPDNAGNELVLLLSPVDGE